MIFYICTASPQEDETGGNQKPASLYNKILSIKHKQRNTQIKKTKEVLKNLYIETQNDCFYQPLFVLYNNDLNCFLTYLSC